MESRWQSNKTNCLELVKQINWLVCSENTVQGSAFTDQRSKHAADSCLFVPNRVCCEPM